MVLPMAVVILNWPLCFMVLILDPGCPPEAGRVVASTSQTIAMSFRLVNTFMQNILLLFCDLSAKSFAFIKKRHYTVKTLKNGQTKWLL